MLAQRLYDEREKTIQQIADMFGIRRSTVYGHLDKTKTVPRQPKKTKAQCHGGREKAGSHGLHAGTCTA